MQCIFHGWVPEALKQLHAVHPQHGLQRVRREAVLPLGIVPAQLLLKLGPPNELFHVIQEGFAPRFALLVGKLDFSEGPPSHGGILLLGYASIT